MLGTTDYHFQAHMNSHLEHQCPHCDYKSRTEGRLKRHIKGKFSAAVPALTGVDVVDIASLDVIDIASFDVINSGLTRRHRYNVSTKRQIHVVNAHLVSLATVDRLYLFRTLTIYNMLMYLKALILLN